MTAPGRGRGRFGATTPPEDFEERFFARQRAEVLDRIEREEHARRIRRAGLPIAAGFLMGALLLGGYALRGGRPAPAPAPVDWLFAWELPSDTHVSDPLAVYTPDMAGTDEAASDDADPGLLPPLAGGVTGTAPGASDDAPGGGDTY